ncbi:MAG: YqeG family HAD IIIA-type phosphatase [Eubacteriales bacterium]|nr:YqeG family HAD IIIA-type phosphatase [Eubacteriales bacterium]
MNNLYPNRYFDKKEDVPFEKLYQQGFRGVIFDIDNTLVPHDAPADEKAIALIQQLKQIGYQICLLSNNKEERVASFNEPLQVHYVYKGGKPLKRGYLQALDKLGTNLEHTLFVGDQIFTDIWGARRVGLYSVLLDPINPKEEIQIVLKRIPEKYVKWNYRRKHHLHKNEYDLE